MRRMVAVILACVPLVGATGGATAQTLAAIDAARPKARILHIPESEAPVIDGALDDAIWTRATDIGRFRQIEPVYDGEPTERTVVRVAYDSTNLYISIYAYDSNPDAIIRTQNVFDGSLIRDDHVKVLIDPNGTRRNAYSFEVNSLGGYTDGLVQNNTDFLKNWNTIWYAAGKRVADGWTAEMAIPFRSLSFDPASTDWGFDIYRWIRRKNENVRWGLRPMGAGSNDVSLTGTLQGFSGMNQGSGLDLQVYGVARYGRYESAGHDDALTFRPSGNLYYKITPSLTGLLTVNTDFSDTPLDAVQVNTTRFSLFQQETRQFFLQDASSFEFGGRAFSSGFVEGSFNNGRPFFSRNIGLIGGRPVSIVAGGKLSGSYENIDIGALTVRTHDPITKKDEQLSVVRLATPVLERSRLGLIFTNGDPTSLSENSVVGGDFQYEDSNIFGTGKRLQGVGYYLRSFSSTAGADDEFGVSAIYPNEPWGGELHFKQIGDDFRPALGFANRRGINEYHAYGMYRERFRGGDVRQYFVQSKNDLFTDLGGRIESRENSLTFETELASGDVLQMMGGNIYENVLTPFLVANTVLVPAGRYTWNYVSPRVEFTTNRPFSATLDVDCCDFYDGQNFHTEVALSYLPNETWGFTFSHSMDLIRLPAGDVDIHILTATTMTNFTPRMNLKTQIQYDNISKRFAALMQYRWEYEAGQELFVAAGETATIESFTNPHYIADNEQFIIRLGHRFQF